jgi:hypothetical protein
VFYTKLLSKIASNSYLIIRVAFEVEYEGSAGEQKKEETKTARLEMGLEENLI